MTLRSLLAVAAVTTCSAGAAMAADLPVRTAPPAPFYPAPIFTWTGFYVGINAGADFAVGGTKLREIGFVPAGGAAATGFGPFSTPSSNVGFVGGGQIGYNIQNGMFVYGVEADIDYFNAGSSRNRTFADNNVFAGGSLTTFGRSGNGYLGTVRGRLGVAAFDRTLLYVTGGLAYGDYGSTTRLVRFNNVAGGVPASFDFSNNNSALGDTRIGYAIGAGVEYAFTQRISGKVEYLYTDLGSRTYNLTGVTNTPTYIQAKTDGTAQMARVGINYKF